MNLREMIGLGVAGNFTGHLEQAGEIDDFVGLEIKDTDAPKGIFPFYLPTHKTSHLAAYPLSTIKIEPPLCGSDIQAEPEVALICDLHYTSDGKIDDITPRFFGAFNDCSIRKKGAEKISDKKNWKANSKGISPRLLPIDTAEIGGVLDRYRITSFLLRDGILHEYGVDSPVSGYSYFGDKLKLWIIDKLNHQIDEGPLESISEALQGCGKPKQAVISIGATRYTEFGEKNYLKSGDELFVLLYPQDRYSNTQISNMIQNGTYADDEISSLHQVVL